jgi:aminoglycoside phosphotransferase family enzyme/predicted kinase
VSVHGEAGEGVDIRALLRPEAWSHPVATLELVETHVSWVVLTGAFAYKIKKPVRFDFVDATSLATRKRLCEEELRLNRRLAAELYLDVVPITAAAGGELRVGCRGPAVEYAVRMRQFDRNEELPALLEHGGSDAVDAVDMADLGARLAEFHQSAPAVVAGERAGCYAQVESLLLDNLASLRSVLGEESDLNRALDAVEDWIRCELPRRRAVIEARKAMARVRDCHGDLHAGNVVRVGGRLLPFDALEFNPLLRWTDVAADVGFLHMDLCARGHGGLASVLLDAWLDACGDYDMLRVLRLYEVHRALVRAKVDAISLGTLARRSRPAWRKRLEERLATAANLMQPRGPTLILMHGPSGSGKSWFSERLVPVLGAVRVRSDRERKRLAGAGDRYAPQVTQSTYARLHECADAALDGGWNIVLDATFLDAGQRDACRQLATRHHAHLLIADCVADVGTLVERVARRASEGRDPSDASREVLVRQLEAGTSLGEVEEHDVVRVDTRDPAALDRVRQRVAAELVEGSGGLR